MFDINEPEQDPLVSTASSYIDRLDVIITQTENAYATALDQLEDRPLPTEYPDYDHLDWVNEAFLETTVSPNTVTNWRLGVAVLYVNYLDRWHSQIIKDQSLKSDFTRFRKLPNEGLLHRRIRFLKRIGVPFPFELRRKIQMIVTLRDIFAHQELEARFTDPEDAEYDDQKDVRQWSRNTNYLRRQQWAERDPMVVQRHTSRDRAWHEYDVFLSLSARFTADLLTTFKDLLRVYRMHFKWLDRLNEI